MSCRQCHLGDDYLATLPLAGRTYVDFSRRSRLPVREDRLTRASRNSPAMVDLGLGREVPALFHFDGEFVDLEDLAVDTLTGRNLGWLPTERSVALAHVARVVREDRGVNPRHTIYPDGSGIPYRLVFQGTDSSLPAALVLPAEYRIDVSTASDNEVVSAVAKSIEAYVHSLRFGTRNTLRTTVSPYDRFLTKNNLPVEPMRGETGRDYATRLLALIDALPRVAWVSGSGDGSFRLHDQAFVFGPAELAGLRLFFSTPGAAEPAKTRTGNCVACHTPPRFTDHSLHNNGVSQAEYDSLHGAGAFASLPVPDLATRTARFDEYLPPSDGHPNASGRFRRAPEAGEPGYADLGVWNVFANPDMPKPQAALEEILCGPRCVTRGGCSRAAVLPLTVGLFKTASVRDLGQSDPYFHSGAMDTIEDLIRFYVSTSRLARSGKLRNGSREMAQIRIEAADVAPLSAFLRSLNEDYR